jgi:hypothetical protein
VHIKCISNCSTYEKLSKNKSCIVCIALHGMAYYIFLKSLKSLEEFRKNPHVKIPPKSPSTNFQSLGKFKNPIFNSKIIFPCFQPGQPCGPFGLWPSQPTGRAVPVGRNSPGRPIQPAHQSRLRGKYIFSFGSRLPEPPASPSSLCQPETHLSDSPPSPCRPTLVGNPPRRCLTPRMPPSFYSPPSSLSPLNPLQWR